MGKLLISHRSTTYPCYIPVLGEFRGSWSYKTYPQQKYTKNHILNIWNAIFFFQFSFTIFA
jgi:hypothetical protein